MKIDPQDVYPVLFWIGAALAWVLSAWTIVATIIEVARGRSRLLSGDVITAILFHGVTAIAAIKLANLAVHGG